MKYVLLYLCWYFCKRNKTIYGKIVNKTTLTPKQQSYILSLNSSITLLCFGIYFNYVLARSNFDVKMYVLNTNASVSMLSIVFFTSYLMSDMVIGHRHYHTFLCTLTGYPHHIVYLFINLLALSKGPEYCSYYNLYMLAELPTTILGIGSLNANLRNDRLFGGSFFLTRILYHSLLTFLLRRNTLVMRVALIVLPVHIYWFKNWLKKYY